DLARSIPVDALAQRDVEGQHRDGEEGHRVTGDVATDGDHDALEHRDPEGEAKATFAQPATRARRIGIDDAVLLQQASNVPRCGPSRRKNGTSAPRLAAIASRWGSGTLADRSSFPSFSAAAASALPPPRPAATGIRFSIRAASRPSPSPASSSRARRTIVSSA